MDFLTENEVKSIASKIIKKQISIVGSQISLAKARQIKSLEINDDGSVLNISGRPKEALQNLVNVYLSLSGDVVKRTIKPYLKNHPDIVVLDI